MEKVSINLIMNVKYKYNLTLCTPGLFRSVEPPTPVNSNSFDFTHKLTHKIFMF